MPLDRLASLLGRRQQGLGLNPVTQSVLAQQLLAQSMQSPQGLVSPSGTLNKALQGFLAGRSDRSQQQDQTQTTARQQGLAGALSRTGSADPAKAEAARRAAMIIAGGIPNDPTAQQLLQGQAKNLTGSGAEKLIGLANPSDFEPASLSKYQKSGNPGDLVPRTNVFGRYTPSQYTTDSWAQFVSSGDPAVLVQRPEFRFQQTPSGALVAGNNLTGQVSPTSVTPQVATDEAAERKRREAEAAAAGQATGAAQGALLTRAFNADNINDILDIAEPLIDEATGSGTGAARDKLASFFGVSTTGAQATAQLLPLQAAIMLNQPRMEGPQSDRDVQLYREAAGQLGDPSVPRETKKAAIVTIRRLQDRYRQRANQQPAAGGMPDLSQMSDEELRRLAGGQ